ncbi:hypothetical protein TNCV_2214301 [Trichonephila clavipes]|nr:hypothetical protein TNCV_2214301 [Trichonephila clavipes]
MPYVDEKRHQGKQQSVATHRYAAVAQRSGERLSGCEVALSVVWDQYGWCWSPSRSRTEIDLKDKNLY